MNFISNIFVREFYERFACLENLVEIIYADFYYETRILDRISFVREEKLILGRISLLGKFVQLSLENIRFLWGWIFIETHEF